MKYLLGWMIAIGLVAGLWTKPAWAENSDDPFDGRLLPIELVISHRQEIGLTKTQRKAIRELVIEVQKSVAEKQWDLQSGYFELIELLDEPKIDEDRAVKVARDTVSIENDIKAQQIRLLIRVRNLLEPEQIRLLRQRLEAGWEKP